MPDLTRGARERGTGAKGEAHTEKETKHAELIKKSRSTHRKHEVGTRQAWTFKLEGGRQAPGKMTSTRPSIKKNGIPLTDLCRRDKKVQGRDSRPVEWEDRKR